MKIWDHAKRREIRFVQKELDETLVEESLKEGWALIVTFYLLLFFDN